MLLARGDRIQPGDLPPELSLPAVREAEPAAPSASLAGPTTLRVAVDEAERSTLLACLQRCGGSRKRAAEELGVNRTTLFNKMRKHGLMETVFDPTVEERAPQPPPRPSP